MVTLKQAKEVADVIVKTVQPISIVVFGSVAEKGIGNDLDILIITEDTARTARELDLIISKSLKTFYKRFAIDPFVVPLSKLKSYYYKGSPFLRLIQREGRALYVKDSVKEWIRHAEDEIKMADYLFKGEFWKGTCYHSQQSIEKSLKVGLLQRGWELEKTHSIERLNAIAEEYNITLKIDEDDITFIDSIYRGRYPAEEGLLPLGEPSKKDAKRALKLAKSIFKKLKT